MTVTAPDEQTSRAAARQEERQPGAEWIQCRGHRQPLESKDDRHAQQRNPHVLEQHQPFDAGDGASQQRPREKGQDGHTDRLGQCRQGAAAKPGGTDGDHDRDAESHSAAGTEGRLRSAAPADFDARHHVERGIEDRGHVHGSVILGCPNDHAP